MESFSLRLTEVLEINYHCFKELKIDQFIYIKIQSQTTDLRTRLWGINPTNSVFIPQSLVPRSIV